MSAEITPGKWQHVRTGRIYTVVGVASLDQSSGVEFRDSDADIFKLEENPTIGLYLRSHQVTLKNDHYVLLTYKPVVGDDDYGDRVFYLNDADPSWRWARPLESFMGEVDGHPRFIRI